MCAFSIGVKQNENISPLIFMFNPFKENGKKKDS